ncbi:Integrase zinc binding domain [Popillia japonica]|uniref:RNA-directed DNA polymerase n=1 Tax=Popillia japonica TaxID=7064 RepID=A0AAW1HF32_POPJA
MNTIPENDNPTKLRRNMIRKIHTNHNGIEATIKLAKESLFWPGMNSQIKEIVQNCEICCKFADSQRKAPMQSHNLQKNGDLNIPPLRHTTNKVMVRQKQQLK